MIRKWWRWLWGEPEPSQLERIVQQTLEHQTKLFDGVLNAVSQVNESSQRQSEILSNYLKMFQVVDKPEKWTDDLQANNNNELVGMGFPSGGTDAEQAKWVLDHINEI